LASGGLCDVPVAINSSVDCALSDTAWALRSFHYGLTDLEPRASSYAGAVEFVLLLLLVVGEVRGGPTDRTRTLRRRRDELQKALTGEMVSCSGRRVLAGLLCAVAPRSFWVASCVHDEEVWPPDF
jgi:hypothetical protein